MQGKISIEMRLLGLCCMLVSSTAALGQQKPEPVGFPDAPGKDVLLAKCFQCHGPGMWLDHRQDRRGWESVLYRMVGRGALWTENEINAMADYLGRIYAKQPGAAAPRSGWIEVPIRTVDLDRPGALAALEKSNPRHFAKLERLLEESTSREAAAVERFVRTAGGTAIRRGDMIKTSYPAKARLWFTLDHTLYVVTVTIPDPRGKPK